MDERSVLRNILEELRSSSIKSVAQLLRHLLDPLRLILTSPDDENQYHICLEELALLSESSGGHGLEPAVILSSSSSIQRYTSWHESVDLAALRKRMLASSFVEDVQFALLTQIGITWGDHMDRSLWNSLLENWFFPNLQDAARAKARQASDTRPFVVEVDAKGKGKAGESQATDEVLYASSMITAAGLRTVTKLLSEARAMSARDGNASEGSLPSAALAPITKDCLLHVLQRLQPCTPLDMLYKGIRHESSRTRGLLQWKDAVAQMTALPARIANLTQGKPPDGLQDKIFFSHFAATLCELVLSMSKNPRASDDPSAVAFCLIRLLRHGFVNITPQGKSATARRETFWGSVIPSVLCHSALAQPIVNSPDSRMLQSFDTNWPRSYRETWLACIDELSGTDRVALRTSMIAFLEVLWSRCTDHGSDEITTTTERHRPGTEGTIFLAKEMLQRAIFGAALLSLFCGRLSQYANFQGLPTSANTAEGGSDGEDAENDNDMISHFRGCISDLILPRSSARASLSAPRYGPSIARSFAIWIQASTMSMSPEKRLEDLSTLLHAMLALWGDASLVRIMSQKEDSYLTVIILALSAQLVQLFECCKGNTNAESLVSAALQKLTMTPDFSNGVAAHLDHGDPLTRRMGMLVAEVITENAAIANIGSAGKSVKPAQLHFGSAIWDGKGEGREEARVLRAMAHSWPNDTMVCSLLRAGDPQAALGIKTSAPVISSAADMSVSDVKLSRSRLPTVRQNSGISKEQRTKTPLMQKPKKASLITLLDEVSIADEHLRTFKSVDDTVEDQSSSGSDSSDEDPPESTKADFGLEDDGTLGSAETALKLPSESRQKVPIYIMELAPLFRKNERQANRIALHKAEALIRKKAGWGGEVDENAADLSFAICGLQNNFGVKDFDNLKTRCLTALICASPRIANGVVIEQFFHPQYSISQRYVMLNAIAFAALELAGETEPTSGCTNEGADRLSQLVSDLSLQASAKAKSDGEAHVPAIQREKALKVSVSIRAPSRPLTASIGGTAQAGPRFPGALVRPALLYIEIAASFFIHPIVTRTWAHMEEASVRNSRAVGGYLGAGAGALFAPVLVARLLDTLSILAHAGRNAREYGEIIAPELLELVIGVARIVYPLAAAHQIHASNLSDNEDASNRLQSASASLVLTVLNDLWEADEGQSLLRRHNSTLNDVHELMEATFQREDARSGKAARPAAAVILRIAEIRSTWKSANVLL
ncbi:hypothetical protein K437DRAFT_271580 [Tilletiaria anomala UBC 951]|uniref:Telomere length regulation protein conserved domain-containing protein n=1 Tax=Tilletiaria anomala (strain ATCC 24038 / CBS 436.72 / UBC 951) TaxID=1037660 RepID=A0A066WLB3_TILAU|nr:uncharacterized protein K437DRAFT_271580 [Tilletiaria anomala UBC 951]KDN53348.1 hypothetical protein K437DRAFT_271580 [Tilletiaria anomala UBC 951]